MREGFRAGGDESGPMRRYVVVLLIAWAVLLAACGDDNGRGLGDNPTKQECFDVMRSVLERLRVPEGVDPSDGLDDQERAKTEDVIEELGRDEGLDISDEDHPCAAATNGATGGELAALVEGIDPDVLELLGAEAQQQFQETGKAIN